MHVCAYIHTHIHTHTHTHTYTRMYIHAHIYAKHLDYYLANSKHYVSFCFIIIIVILDKAQ